jgi:hypothetical protein
MPTLDYSQTYSCPLCLRGEIRAFPLMDAFGCDFWLVSRIFRAGSKTKNRALLHKGFRKPKSGARINKDTNDFCRHILALV